MAELNVKEEIGRYDKALAEYYNAMGRNDYYDMGDDKKGKFEFYCEDNGFDEFEWEDWNEEMKLVEDGDTECLLLGFDENFPYNSTDKNDNEMKQKLIEILKLIKNKQEIPITEQESTQLDVSMFKDITDQMVDDNLAKYSNQMPSFIQVADKDKELKYVISTNIFISYDH